MSASDPLLLELLESACSELARALDSQSRWAQAFPLDAQNLAAHADRISRLQTAMTALEHAIDQVENRNVH